MMMDLSRRTDQPKICEHGEYDKNLNTIQIITAGQREIHNS